MGPVRVGGKQHDRQNRDPGSGRAARRRRAGGRHARAGIRRFESSGGGASAVTTARPRDGNGSVELHGDRTRFADGDYFNPASNLGSVRDLTGLAFDYLIAADSVSALGPDLTPALRVHIFDEGRRSELIWEGAYNNLGTRDRETWYGSGLDDLFWQFRSGSGTTTRQGVILVQSITAWVTEVYSADAYVSAFSIGVGGSAGAGYRGFADNLRVRTADGAVQSINFEAAAVPEPASWAMMIAGFGLVGGALRLRSSGRRRCVRA